MAHHREAIWREAIWKEGPVLAWTDREGPGRPPAGPNRTLSLGLAAALGVVFAGMLATDALCPEHRAWVQGLATVALVGTATAAVGLVRGWSVAPLLTLGVASLGVAIGALDAVHDATRGRVLIVAFALAALAATALGARQARLARWGRHVGADLGGLTVDGLPTTTTTTTTTDEAADAAAARPPTRTEHPSARVTPPPGR